ncbi:MAG: hypothetical protein V3S29_02165, partial [bacterium]
MSANAITVGMGQNRPALARRGRAAAARWWCGTALALVAMLLFAGCLSDAADTCYPFTTTTCDETSTGSSGVVIAYVTTLSEVVVLVNQGSLDQDLTNWTLEVEGSSDPADIYTFGTFTLSAGHFVRLHS